MAVFPGTYIPTGVASSGVMNHLIDDLLTPRLMSFRQICFYDEQAVLCRSSKGTANTNYSGAVTSIVVDNITNPSAVPSTGFITLVNGSDEQEQVAYTAFDGVNTFTVSATLTYSYLAGDIISTSTWEMNFGNWLADAPVKARKNGAPYFNLVNVDYEYGTFQIGEAVDTGLDGRPRDTIELNYTWDYFPVAVLEGMFTAAVSIINMTAIGPPTNYTVDTAPENWEGVMVDIVFAMCMEKLLLDYDLWKYRLIFAIGPTDVYGGGGGGDIVSQLETLKQNAEERANKAMENEKFKTGNYLSPPTNIYYDSIRGFGGSRGPHGIPFLTGRLRGWKPNKWL